MKLKYTVEIEFTNPVTSDKELLEVQANVMAALVEQVNHAGLAPEENEAFTKNIKVSHKDIKIAKYFV